MVVYKALVASPRPEGFKGDARNRALVADRVAYGEPQGSLHGRHSEAAQASPARCRPSRGGVVGGRVTPEGKVSRRAEGEDSLGRSQRQDMGPDSPFGETGRGGSRDGISCTVVAVCSNVRSWERGGNADGQESTSQVRA